MTTPLPTTMQAFVIDPKNHEDNPLDNGALITNHPLPTIPNEKYALVKILRAGICNTDLEILQGYMGFGGILGHEFVGKVIQLHPTASQSLHDQWIGQRVCGDINIGCCNFSSDHDSTESSNSSNNNDTNSTSCRVCNNKFNYNQSNSQMSRNHCPNRTVIGILNQNGTFAEYMTLPLSNLHLVHESIPDEIAVFAEPLAAACRVVEQGLVQFRYSNGGEECRGGDRVAILGDGKLGLCIAEILGREYLLAQQKQQQQEQQNGGGIAPHAPILFGKHEHKLDLVSDSGVQRRLVKECYTNEMTQEEVSPHHANQYDVVIDSTGNPNGLTLAMTLCRPMGRLVLKSTCAAGVKGFNSAPIVIDELNVVGSRCGPIDRALELLEGNSTEGVAENGVVVSAPLRMEKYITESFPLSRVRDALECAAKKSTMKVQLVMAD
mmetsp:Transcript_3834/g.5696  ORF Transcript_3834/g.5696 Transcript_3834/m.5696 type:complete len:436 (-) Transcript_3834:1070-2377(-)